YLGVHSLFDEGSPGKIDVMISDLDLGYLFLYDSENRSLLGFEFLSGEIRTLSRLPEMCSGLLSFAMKSLSEMLVVCEGVEAVNQIDLRTGSSSPFIASDELPRSVRSIQKLSSGYYLSGTSGEFAKLGLDAELEFSRAADISKTEIDWVELTQSLMDSLGNVHFVASMPRHIYMLDSVTGEKISQYGGRGRFEGQFSQLEMIMETTDGQIVACDAHNNRISVYSQSGDYSHSFGYSNTDPGAFHLPKDLHFDESGRLHVYDQGNARVQVFDSSLKLRDIWSADTRASTPWNNAVPLKAIRGGSYLLFQSDGTISVFDPSTNQFAAFEDLYGDHIKSLEAPSSGLLLKDGRMLVADKIGNKLIVISNRQVERVIENKPSTPHEEVLSRPTDVEQDPSSGNILVFQEGRDKILIYDRGLQFVRQISVAKTVKDFAIGPKGYIYAVEPKNDRVLVYNHEGDRVLEIGPELQGIFRLKSPQAVAVRKDGVIAVSDTGHNRVQLFPRVQLPESQ
ncbi:MAG: NHL repeat-containing protein, partial [Pseudomonadota bacterium]